MREQFEVKFKGIDYSVDVDYQIGRDVDGKFCQINDMSIQTIAEETSVTFEYKDERLFSGIVIDMIMDVENDNNEY